MKADAPLTWFEKKVALSHVRNYSKLCKNKIRIGAGYFSVSGYNLIRKYLADKDVLILISLQE